MFFKLQSCSYCLVFTLQRWSHYVAASITTLLTLQRCLPYNTVYLTMLFTLQYVYNTILITTHCCFHWNIVSITILFHYNHVNRCQRCFHDHVVCIAAPFPHPWDGGVTIMEYPSPYAPVWRKRRPKGPPWDHTVCGSS
jgi:hypothetical protein